MIEIKGGAKEQIVRQWFNDQHGGLVPKEKVLDLFSEFEASEPIESISYGLFNGVMKKIKAEGHASSQSAAVTAAAADGHSVDEPIVIKVEDMEFPEFKLHKSGKWIDRLFSDHEEGGGLYGGTVNIVIGESGVGKSTVMLDLLAAMKLHNPDAKLLYISSEMTRNDIMFYYRKTPAIGQVPTLLLMDYVKTGNLAQVLEKTLNGDYDIILLDSYQDVLVKLKEVHSWRSTYAESWLTNSMIDAAEKQGCSVLAIQHMTKGGTYVGSTYLKHATTAMLEIRFDLAGNRYLEFSKNRRGGSSTGKRLYYSLNDAGDVVYDVERFTETEDMHQLESNETVRQSELSRQFEEIFLKKKPEAEEPVVVHSVDEAPFELIETTVEDVEEEEEN